MAAFLATLLGSAVSDSGAIVGGVTLMVVATALAVLVLEPERVPTAPARAEGTAGREVDEVEPELEPPPRPEPEPVPGAGSRRS